MNWDAIAAAAELLGAMGVVASLLYLARQMKNSAADGRRAAAQSVLAKIATSYERISAHPQLAKVFVRGSAALSALDPEEALQFAGFLHSFLRPYEELLYYRRAGAVEDWVWESVERSVLPVLSTPGALEYWAKRKSWYSTAFQSHVVSRLSPAALDMLKGFEHAVEGRQFRAGMLVETGSPPPPTRKRP